MVSERIKARIIIVTDSCVLTDFPEMWFSNYEHAERYMEGLAAGYGLTHKKDAGVVAFINDKLKPAISKNISLSKTSVLLSYLKMENRMIWDEMASEIRTQPEVRQQYSKLFPDAATSEKLESISVKLIDAYNIVNCAYCVKEDEFVIDRFKTMSEACECFYGLIPFSDMQNASIEKYDDGSYWICVKGSQING